MSVFSFVVKSKGGEWSAKQRNGYLQAGAPSLFELQSKLVKAATALSFDSSGGVRSAYSPITPNFADFEVIIGGGGVAASEGAAAEVIIDDGGAAAAEVPLQMAPLEPNGINYWLWKSEITRKLKSLNLLGFVDRTIRCPDAFLLSETGALTETINPAYLEWINTDQMVRGLIIRCLAPSAVRDTLPRSIDSYTTLAILAKEYASVSLCIDPDDDSYLLADKTENLEATDAQTNSFSGLRNKEEPSDILISGDEGEEEEPSDLSTSDDCNDINEFFNSIEMMSGEYVFDSPEFLTYTYVEEDFFEEGVENEQTRDCVPVVKLICRMHSVFVNFTEICKRLELNRDEVIKFLMESLGTKAHIDEKDRLFCYGKFSPGQFQSVMLDYLVLLDQRGEGRVTEENGSLIWYMRFFKDPSL